MALSKEERIDTILEQLRAEDAGGLYEAATQIYELLQERSALRYQFDELTKERDGAIESLKRESEELDRVRDVAAIRSDRICDLETVIENVRADRDREKALAEERFKRIQELEVELKERQVTDADGMDMVELSSVTEAEVARTGQRLWWLICTMGVDGRGFDGLDVIVPMMQDVTQAMMRLKLSLRDKAR